LDKLASGSSTVAKKLGKKQVQVLDYLLTSSSADPKSITDHVKRVVVSISGVSTNSDDVGALMVQRAAEKKAEKKRSREEAAPGSRVRDKRRAVPAPIAGDPAAVAIADDQYETGRRVQVLYKYMKVRNVVQPPPTWLFGTVTAVVGARRRVVVDDSGRKMAVEKTFAKGVGKLYSAGSIRLSENGMNFFMPRSMVTVCYKGWESATLSVDVGDYYKATITKVHTVTTAETFYKLYDILYHDADTEMSVHPEYIKNRKD
jgi:hypothetical protein